MASTVYIETTIPSAYVSTRTDPGSLYRRDATQQWWREQLPEYRPFISANVLIELRNGSWPGQSDAISLVESIQDLEIDEEVIGVAQRYITEKLVPANLAGDAMHLAVATLFEVDYLLTWNIRHLANPNKLDHLNRINRRLGLLTPIIVTPDMLWLE